MKYTYYNKTSKPVSDIHIIEVSSADFKIIMNDSRKKFAAPRNYCNAGFFATFSENKQYFTLPVAHLLCDYDATSSLTKHYCTERGKFNGKKFTFDSSTWEYQNTQYKKAISTLLVNNKTNKVEIKEIVSIPTGYNYAISGIPIMRNGVASNMNKDVASQGWSSSPLYGTWHIFIGLKKNDDTIYIIGMKTTTWNMVQTGEAYKKFQALDMYDVIKLDGGGSFHIDVNGKTVAGTSENRLINTIICFDGIVEKDTINGSGTKDGATDTSKDANTNKENATNKVSGNKTNTNTTNIKKPKLPPNLKAILQQKNKRINLFKIKD